jgi:hypothetical protein
VNIGRLMTFITGVSKMKTVELIKYEIDFIETELKEKNFPYLTEQDLKVWLTALNWTLGEQGEDE